MSREWLEAKIGSDNMRRFNAMSAYKQNDDYWAETRSSHWIKWGYCDVCQKLDYLWRSEGDMLCQECRND